MFTPIQADSLGVLRQSLKGIVRSDDEAIAGVSVDFGGIVRQKPQAVVWPANGDDVATMIRQARELGWIVSVRGTGHSQGGQSLNQAGVVLDTRSLAGIEMLNKSEGWVITGTGTQWDALARTTIEHELLPPVLTDNLAVTVGGTLSMGGIGPTSFRRGLQIHHCLGVEVVLGTGEMLWLTPDHEPELFQHILCGLGQFGAITKAKLRLRPFRPYTQSVYLSYHTLEAFLHDAVILMQRDQVHGLEGGALPNPASPTAERPQRYLLEAATEVELLADEVDPQLSQGLSGEAHWIVVNRPTPEYVFRLAQRFVRYKRPAEQNCAHPWVEHFLPLANVEEYVEAVASDFPSTSLLLWPLQTEKLRWPMFALPEAAEVMLVGIMANIPNSPPEETLLLLRQASQLGINLGGKRYLSGWIDFDQEQWRQHYGPVQWQRIKELKQHCDPARIFQFMPQ